MRRARNAKIVATLGPASSDPEAIRRLFEAGADVFRLNFSHGTQEDHRRNFNTLRALERDSGRPISILQDLQGPKLRVGRLEGGKVTLEKDSHFRLDLDETPGTAERAPLPHPEIFAALQEGATILLDDGRLYLEVIEAAADHAKTRVVVGGILGERKGVNVPSVVLPISPLTPKDRDDLAFGLEMGVDWVALSFVQRPEDVAELRKLVAGRAAIMIKVEKPAAVDCLEQLLELADGAMVARGDLGVEMAPEEVPGIQKDIIRACRLAGKPVVVATQMLDSMVHAPAPTRAEASDVATAIYDGADAVMLSAESAAGDYPVEAVAMMCRIIERTERDRSYRAIVEALHPEPEPNAADAISEAAAQVAMTISAAAIVTYTTSGSTALRAARRRPTAPILLLTAQRKTARRLVLLWGAHAVHTADISSFPEMVEKAASIARREGFAEAGSKLVITAGVPFGTPGATNVLRIAWVE
ncbi:pyruvate kinase [Aquibaculum arenosum]|uniref:Pyruvate kinase n=1 Tax=Aquibaculum arenosum TaxID=3032591 RepID=A0ABT5YQH4_9PROT|nr:pyruvate kinase [Fodinicurvata sp. CAU 1616]MDF2097031.1 pyruvate kinase [Fodinicurvata sp. CAU 1616]